MCGSSAWRMCRRETEAIRRTTSDSFGKIIVLVHSTWLQTSGFSIMWNQACTWWQSQSGGEKSMSNLNKRLELPFQGEEIQVIKWDNLRSLCSNANLCSNWRADPIMNFYESGRLLGLSKISERERLSITDDTFCEEVSIHKGLQAKPL